MKKKDTPIIKYFLGIFFPVYIGVAFREQDYLAEVKRLGVKNPGEYHHSTASVKYFTNKDNKMTCIICFDPIKWQKLSWNTVAALLAHEATHCADETFKHVGENTPGGETRAYFVQYVLQETLYQLDDFMKSKKVKKHDRRKSNS